jgi:transcriptional regulator with XRE-family HTH domain
MDIDMTKEEIGKILKQLRIDAGMTQKEVAEALGKSQPLIGHWETGYSQPDANTLFTLCSLYGTTVDKAFGFDSEDNLTRYELSFIEKFRQLDNHGKELMSILLEKELQRCNASSVKGEEAKSIPPADQDIHNIKRPVISEKEIFEFLDSDEPATLNAAHERTDIEVTDDMKRHDDDIMDDDDF